MRVLIFKPGEVNEYGYSLAVSLVQAGLNVTMVCDKDYNLEKHFNVVFKPKKIFYGYIKTEEKLVKGLKYIISFIVLIFTLLKERPNIIHIQWFKFTYFELFLFQFLKLFNIKIVYTCHDVIPPDASKLEVKFYSGMFNKMDLIFTHSEVSRKEIINQFHIDENKIRKITFGNYNIVADNYNKDKLKSRESLGLSTNDNIIMFFGSIRKYKGLEILINAFRKTKEINGVQRLKLIIAGGGFCKFFRLANEHLDYIKNNRDIILDIDYCDYNRMGQYFAATDLVVLPYKRISMSAVLATSLSFGRPIIATEVGGLPEYIIPNETGFIIPSNDVDMMVQTIIDAFKNKDQLLKMGRKCREYADKIMSWEIVAKETIEGYKYVLNK